MSRIFSGVPFAFGLVALMLVFADSGGLAQDRKGIRFWNLTLNTITHLQLSPAGKNTWGLDQCRNDRDGTVDHDERLRITGIDPGRYYWRVAGVTADGLEGDFSHISLISVLRPEPASARPSPSGAPPRAVTISSRRLRAVL